MKRGLVISIILNMLLLCLLYYIGECRTDYFKRIHARLVDKTYVPVRSDDDCVNSWSSCIRKLNLDVNVVFFGNSITEGGEWQDYFPDHKVITLAYIGEDTKGMLRRVNLMVDVNPEKVFLMAGINGLKNQSLPEFERWYSELLDSVCNVLSGVHIYVQSILPVTAESDFCPNEKIVEANTIIEKLVHEKPSDIVHYVDLWNVYAENGALPNYLSYDGLHLNEDAYIHWVNTIRKFMEK